MNQLLDLDQVVLQLPYSEELVVVFIPKLLMLVLIQLVKLKKIYQKILQRIQVLLLTTLVIMSEMLLVWELIFLDLLLKVLVLHQLFVLLFTISIITELLYISQYLFLLSELSFVLLPVYMLLKLTQLQKQIKLRNVLKNNSLFLLF